MLRFQNVPLRETAFTELRLPINVRHGKVCKLKIHLPWYTLLKSRTTVELDGLHLLVVPATSVAYDPVNEEKLAQETKRSQLEKGEQYKIMAEKTKVKKGADVADDTAETAAAGGDTMLQQIISLIMKNLEVSS